MTLAIILNKHARNAEKIAGYLEELSRCSLEFELHEVNSQDLDTTIQDCIKQHSMILVGGGDGTIRSAAQWCANTPTILGVLPLGTLNHFAKELGLPLNQQELVQAIKKRLTLTIDVAEVNNSIFINNSSIGFYPKFAQKRDYYTRFYSKWLSYIPSFLQTFRFHESFNITIKNSHLNYSLHTSFFMVSNNLYSYQFPIKIAREACDKGLLGLYFFKHGKLRLFKVIKSFFMRKNSFEIMETIHPIKVNIESKENILISLDGDTFTKQLPLVYKTHPLSLTLLVSKS